MANRRNFIEGAASVAAVTTGLIPWRKTVAADGGPLFPVAIVQRPFAIVRQLNVMMPDGIFDSSIATLDIGFFVTNISDRTFSNLFVRSPALEEWRYLGDTKTEIGFLPPGGAALVRWQADFRGVSVGKKTLSVEFNGQFDATAGGEATGADGILRPRIFVSRTTFDDAVDEYTCEVPEGKLRARYTQVSFGPGGRATVHPLEGPPRTVDLPPLAFPENMSLTVVPTNGSANEIPFMDPWWKIVAVIIAIVAAIAALILAKEGKGTASISVSDGGGTLHNPRPGEIGWCAPREASGGPGELEDSPAGIASIIATTALAVALADAIDPWERGREKYPPAPTDPNVAEQLSVAMRLPDQMQAGSAYDVGVRWSYSATRRSGTVLTLDADETRTAEHYLVKKDVRLPATVKANERVRLRVYLEDKGGPLPSSSLFAHATFVPPNSKDRALRVSLRDEAIIDRSSAVNSGWFAAEINLAELAERGVDVGGRWAVTLVGQNVNDASDDMSPKEAATHVGGYALMAPITNTRGQDGKALCPPDQEYHFVVI